MPPSFWVASTKPEAALARGQGWQPWQERGWTLAPRDRGPEAGMYCWKGHYMGDTQKLSPDEQIRSAREEYENGSDFTLAVEEEFDVLDPEPLSLANRLDGLQH